MMRSLGDSLPAELRERIEMMKMGGTSAGGTHPHRPSPTNGEEALAGNIIRMPLRKGTAKQPTGRPAGTVVPFRKSIDRKHG